MSTPLKAVFLFGFVAFDLILLAPVLMYPVKTFPYITGIIVALSLVPIFVILLYKDKSKQNL